VWRNVFRRTAILAALGTGLMLGVSAFTFGYARGYSYLTNDPAACANCHVMSEHFSAWIKSSHRAVARCNDCHAPHSLLGKYITKARNGFWHSFYFTVGRYPDPLRITPRNQAITEEACRYCHSDIVDAIEPIPARDRGAATSIAPLIRAAHPNDSCVRCHAYVGHLVR
jgi:cytochrome c nitrite reductase small subunit